MRNKRRKRIVGWRKRRFPWQKERAKNKHRWLRKLPTPPEILPDLSTTHNTALGIPFADLGQKIVDLFPKRKKD